MQERKILIKKMNEKERKEGKERPQRAAERGGPTIPLGRQIELKVELEDGTIFRHPKKEGSVPVRMIECGGGKLSKYVQVQKQTRGEDGRMAKVASRNFGYGTAAEHRSALKSAVRFRDGLWAEVAAGKDVDQLKAWARDWKDRGSKEKDANAKGQK